MSELTIDIIKKRNDELDKEVMGKPSPQIIESIEKHINDIVLLSSEADSFDDYRWLSDTAVKWQSVLSTTFGEPRPMIALAKPKREWLPPTPTVFTEKEIENWLRSHAAFIAFARRAESGRGDSTPSDDWHAAEVFFAAEVLEGRVNFASRISSKSYWRLERIWLEDAKCHMAYLKWVKERNLFLDHDNDFFNACNHIRDMLINNKEGIKAQISEFNGPKNFIQEHFLDEDGKLLPKEQGTKPHGLIEKKASRIHITTGSTDRHKNWVNAETYVKMFYENIIPAVENKDEEKVLRVLKAFQYSKMNRFSIINCFETALAIYFLDMFIIEKLWKDSEGKPHPNSSVESIVEVDSWPQRFSIDEPCKARFWVDGNRIGFKGVMLDVEKESLEKALKVATSGKPEIKHIEAIKKLYEQSRLIQRDTTL